MKIHAVLAQLPVTRDVAANTKLAVSVVREHSAADLIVFPEGFVSGYTEDLAWLADADVGGIASNVDALARVAAETGPAICVGSLVFRDGAWFNVAFGFMADGTRCHYDKVNLAFSERGRVTPGADLPVFEVPLAGHIVPVGFQLCREVRHPEQWRALAASGAKVFIHLNNALVAEKPNLNLWRSLLISRAIENQRVVLSVNAAGSHQRVPTIAISPDGEVIAECAVDEPSVVELDFDLSAVSDTYLEQVRRTS